jgi:hypothetical protein
VADNTTASGFNARLKHVDGTSLGTARIGYVWFSLGEV